MRDRTYQYLYLLLDVYLVVCKLFRGEKLTECKVETSTIRLSFPNLIFSDLFHFQGLSIEDGKLSKDSIFYVECKVKRESRKAPHSVWSRSVKNVLS